MPDSRWNEKCQCTVTSALLKGEDVHMLTVWQECLVAKISLHIFSPGMTVLGCLCKCYWTASEKRFKSVLCQSFKMTLLLSSVLCFGLCSVWFPFAWAAEICKTVVHQNGLSLEASLGFMESGKTHFEGPTHQRSRVSRLFSHLFV